jgi:uncharacterized protein YcfL
LQLWTTSDNQQVACYRHRGGNCTRQPLEIRKTRGTRSTIDATERPLLSTSERDTHRRCIQQQLHRTHESYLIFWFDSTALSISRLLSHKRLQMRSLSRVFNISLGSCFMDYASPLGWTVCNFCLSVSFYLLFFDFFGQKVLLLWSFLRSPHIGHRLAGQAWGLGTRPQLPQSYFPSCS